MGREKVVVLVVINCEAGYDVYCMNTAGHQ
jgi:hypothetical protein